MIRSGTIVNALPFYAPVAREELLLLSVLCTKCGYLGSAAAAHRDCGLALHKLAEAAYEAGDYDRALERFKKAAGEFEVAERMYRRSGDEDKAKAARRDAAAAHGDCGLALYNLAEAAGEAGNHAEALEKFREAAREFEVAEQMYRRAGDKDKAKVARRGAATAHRNCGLALCNLAGAAYEAVDYDRALERLKEAAGEFEVAEQMYRRAGDKDEAKAARRDAAAAHGDCGLALYNLAEAAYEAGDYDRALERFKKAAGEFEVAEQMYRRAGDKDKAKAARRGAATAHRNCGLALHKLAEAAGEAGNHAEALEKFREAAREFEVAGRMYRRAGDEDKAKVARWDAATAHRNCGLALRNLAGAAYEAVDYDRALERLKEAAGEFEVAEQMYRRAGDEDKAKVARWDAATAHRNCGLALRELAEAAYEAGDYDRALERLKEAAGEFEVAGRMYRRAGDEDKAKAARRDAAAAHGDCGLALYNLVEAAYEAGDYDRALERLKEAAGEFEVAEQMYRRAGDKDKAMKATALASLAWVWTAKAYLELAEKETGARRKRFVDCAWDAMQWVMLLVGPNTVTKDRQAMDVLKKIKNLRR